MGQAYPEKRKVIDMMAENMINTAKAVADVFELDEATALEYAIESADIINEAFKTRRNQNACKI